MNSDLGMLSSWYMANKLSLNASKSQYVLFMNNKPIENNYQILINNEIIKQTKIAKFLGIIINEGMTWQEHINSCNERASSGLYAMGSACKTYLLTSYQHNTKEGCLYNNTLCIQWTYDRFIQIRRPVRFGNWKMYLSVCNLWVAQTHEHNTHNKLSNTYTQYPAQQGSPYSDTSNTEISQELCMQTSKIMAISPAWSKIMQELCLI